MKKVKVAKESLLNIINLVVEEASFTGGNSTAGANAVVGPGEQTFTPKAFKKRKLGEADINDPVLMAMRAKKDAPKPQASKPNPNQAKINMLMKKRAEIERDMEQEAEPEGGKIADEYGVMLNKIDSEIAKLRGHGEWGPEGDPYMSQGEIRRRAAMIKESPGKVHIATNTADDSDIYFEPSTGAFHYNVIDGNKNRWNKLEVNTVDDVVAKFPSLKWTDKGRAIFKDELHVENVAGPIQRKTLDQNAWDEIVGHKAHGTREKLREAIDSKPGDTSTDEILTYLQAAKQQGKLSPDAQQVLLQWMNDPHSSRDEIIKVLRQLTGMYLKEGEVSESKGEWTVKSLEALINDYAAGKNLAFKPVVKRQQADKYGGKKTMYIYKLGDKDLVMIDDRAGGAPRLNEFTVVIGTMDPGGKSLKNTLSVSKSGSWGTSDIIEMLDKAFRGKDLKEGTNYDVLTGGLPHKIRTFTDEETGYEYEQIIITEPIPDDPKSDLVRKFRDAGWRANPNMGGGITATRETGRIVDSLQENYSKFKTETKTRNKSDQFHQAVREVKKRVQEINRLFEYVNRLKTELSEGNDGLKYKVNTEKAITQIKEMVSSLNKNIRKFS